MRLPIALTLRQRVSLSLLPLVALMLALGVAGMSLLGHLGSRTDAILRENYASVMAMERLNEALERIDSSFQFALAGQEPSARAQYEASWGAYRDSLRFEQGNVTVPGEGEAVERLAASTERYRTQGDAFYARAAGDPSRPSAYFAQGGLLDLFKAIKSSSGEIRRMNADTMEEASRRAKATAAHSEMGLFAGLVAALALAAFSMWNTVRSCLAPIEEVTASALAIGRGDLEQRVRYAAPDELGALASAFNHMVEALDRKVAELRASRASVEARTAELERAEEKYRSIFENAVDGIFQSTPEGRFLTVNRALATMLGYATPQELMTSIHHIGGQIHADPLRRAEFVRLLAREGKVHDFEAKCLRKDGSTVWLSFTARAVRAPGADTGDVLFYEGFIADVTTRRLAEEQVMRLADLHAVAAGLGQRALRPDSSADPPGRVRGARREGARRGSLQRDGAPARRRSAPAPGGRRLEGGPRWAALTVRERGLAAGLHGALGASGDRRGRGARRRASSRWPCSSGERVESSMSVVIPTRTGPYGALGVHARRRRVFTRDEVDFLQTVANVLGAAIERSTAEDRLRRLNRAHRALSRCNEALIRASDELAWMGEVCRIIVEEAGYRLCWVGRAEHDEARAGAPDRARRLRRRLPRRRSTSRGRTTSAAAGRPARASGRARPSS